MNEATPEETPDPSRPTAKPFVKSDVLESVRTVVHELQAIHIPFVEPPADPRTGMQNETDMPFNSFYLSRYVGFASIAVVIVGVGIAIFFLNLTGDWPQIQKVLALIALWFTNLIALVLNAIVWFIRRGPRWLTVLLGIQVVIVISGAIPVFSG